MENTFIILGVTSPHNPLSIFNHLQRVWIWKYSCVDSFRCQISSPVESPSSYIFQWNRQDKMQPYYHYPYVCPLKENLDLSLFQGVFSFPSLAMTSRCCHSGHKGRLQSSVHLRQPFQPFFRTWKLAFPVQRGLSPQLSCPLSPQQLGCSIRSVARSFVGWDMNQVLVDRT